jgi:hypothetical protein
VIVCVPGVSVDVVQVATPLPLSVAGFVQPATLLAPSMNVTVPLGVPAPGLFTVTVAVNVTG